jgi:hypothetical protein
MRLRYDLPLTTQPGGVFDCLPGASTSSEAPGQSGQIRLTPPHPAEWRCLRICCDTCGVTGGAILAPANQGAVRNRHTCRHGGARGAAAAAAGSMEPAAVTGPAERRRSWRTGADGTACHNSAGGGGARTRIAASLHAAGPGQLADSHHSPVFHAGPQPLAWGPTGMG